MVLYFYMTVTEHDYLTRDVTLQKHIYKNDMIYDMMSCDVN